MERLDPRAGGAEAYVIALARKLVAAGWEVHLFGIQWVGVPAEARFHRIAVPAWLPAWIRVLWFALGHRRRLRGHSFDVVVGFGRTIAMNAYQTHWGVHRRAAARVALARSTRLSRTLARVAVWTTPKHLARHWIESAPFRIHPRPLILAISELIRRDLADEHGVDESSIPLVWNGVDRQRFSPAVRQRATGALRRQLATAAGDVVFLLVAYALLQKGILPLIEAVARMHLAGRDGFRVWVVGASPSWVVRRRLTRLRCGDRFRFAGRTTVVEQYYGEADVLVHPTFSDACPLVMLEALACGVPVITTAANGLAERIVDGAEGFVIPSPPAPRVLADRMSMLLAAERRHAMALAAAAAGALLDEDTQHNLVLEHLERLAARPPAGLTKAPRRG